MCVHCDQHFSKRCHWYTFFYFPFFFLSSLKNCIQIRFGGKFDIYFCAWYIYKSVLLCLLLFLWYCYWTMRLGYTHNTYKNYLIPYDVICCKVLNIIFRFSVLLSNNWNNWNEPHKEKKNPMNIFITKTGKKNYRIRNIFYICGIYMWVEGIQVHLKNREPHIHL